MSTRKTLAIIGAVILVIVTLIIDLSFAPGVVHGVPFVVLISMSFWLPWRPAPVLLALVGTLLFVARFLYFANGAEAGTLGYNVGMEAAVLWVTALLVMAYRNSAQSLEDREKRLKALVETAVDGVIIIDALGRVQEYNPACERLFGYGADEVVGQNVRMLMPAPYREEHDQYLSRYRSTGIRRIIGVGREVEGRRKDGSTFPMELSVGEARPGGKQVFVGIIRDVTARHAAERSLRVAKEQAEGASRAKSIFLANMSHEIRTPMNAVLGYTQVLENDADLPAKFRRPLKAIRAAGNHLIGLIDDILDLSKIEAGAMELHARPFDLLVLLEGVAEMFQMRCEQKRLEWEASYDIQEQVVIGDDRKLRQVLINLLGNAVKFTDQGRIRLEVSQSGQRYRFAVVDTGPGISEQGRERLFEPFQQAEEGSIKGGTGLGLAISRRQVELMGGRLALDTVLGAGSRFHFELTLVAAATLPSQCDDGSRPVIRLAPGYRLRALVVDDVGDNRDVLSRLLETAGIETVQASNGAGALSELERGAFDVVFMDVRMPVMDGIAALQAIRGRWPERKLICIAITASGLLRQPAYYQAVGFDDFLAKPFRFEKLCERLEKHLAVAFERERTEPPIRGETEAFEVDSCSIPAELHRRLQRAAETNALSEIEAALAELRRLDEPSRRLADRLAELVSSYDMEGIAAVLGSVRIR